MNTAPVHHKMKNNFNLSSTEFEVMLRKLQSGDESLFEKIFLTHFELCTKKIQSKFRCNYDDAYDATMNTLIEFRKRLIDGKVIYGNLEYLFFLIAKQTFLRQKKEFVITEFSEKHVDTNQPSFCEEDISTLEQSWTQLGTTCQEILGSNFYAKIKLSVIANETNRTHLAVRKHKKRCLDKLLASFLQLSGSTQNQGLF